MLMQYHLYYAMNTVYMINENVYTLTEKRFTMNTFTKNND